MSRQSSSPELSAIFLFHWVVGTRLSPKQAWQLGLANRRGRGPYRNSSAQRSSELGIVLACDQSLLSSHFSTNDYIRRQKSAAKIGRDHRLDFTETTPVMSRYSRKALACYKLLSQKFQDFFLSAFPSVRIR